MGDKVIGKLTLDISDVEKKVAAVNTALANIGKGATVKLSIADEVKKQIDKVYQEIERGAAKVQNAAASVSKSMEEFGGKQNKNKALSDTINTLKEYYNMLIKVEQARQQGNAANEALYGSRANQLEASIAQIRAQNAELVKQAEAYKTVQDAQRRLTEYQNKTAAKQDAAQTKEIEQATQSYIKMLEARSKLKQLEAEGKQDTAEYAKVAKASGEAYDAFMKYSKGAREAAIASKEALNAQRDLANIESAVAQKASQEEYLANVKQKYFELTDAIKKYNAEQQVKNTAGMADEQAKIDSIMSEVHAVEQVVQASNMEASAKQQILNIIQQCTTAETQHNSAIQKSATSYSEIESQITGVMTRMFSLMAIIRAINSLISNTVEYVSAYYDKMNEIQIITQKSNEEVAQLGETYRNIAEMMNVSTLDIADSAIYFTRQGLAAAEIENRLVNVTRYAKTANVEFKEASEIVTAVVNSMGLVEQEAEDGRNATQRVADVFLKVGDSAATSGQEIGSAMQKAAASAGAFGMSFEWLAAYIATVSETTRQEARTIGTALNTIIARLHQIKQNGYNSEDETKINDVQKALAKIDVALMDQNNEWRDMDTIFQEIGEKWGTLDGKTKSYIATTMAGVKQQNVFLALMNDLGKQVEGNSRAWELYNLAIDSAGTAEEKYAIWTDSVAASQERLNLAQEKFYSLLNANVIKGWNDTLAGVVGSIADAAEQVGGLNIIIPVAIGLITAFSIAMKSAASASAFFASVWEHHPILVAIGASALVVAGLVTLISGFISAIETAEEKVAKANQTIEDSKENLQDLTSLQSGLNDALDSVGNQGNYTTDELSRFADILSKISNISPEAKQAIDDLNDGLINERDAAARVNEELEKQIENNKRLAMLALVEKYGNTTPASFNKAQSNTDWARNYTDYNGNVIEYSFSELLYRKYLDFQSSFGNLPGDVYNAINDIIDQYDLDPHNEKDWGLVADLIWGKYSLGNERAFTDQMTAVAQEAIDDTVSTLEGYLDNVQAGVLRQRLMEAVFGKDMQLDESEYSQYAANIANVVRDLLVNGIESTPEATLAYIGQDLFGVYFDMMFRDEIADLFTGDPDYVDFIAEAYGELLAAGFSKNQMAEVFKSLPMRDWGDAADVVRDNLKESIKQALGTNFLGEIIEEDLKNGEVSIIEDELLWNDIDISTLQNILSIIEQGNMTIHDFNYMMEMSGGDTEKFSDSVRELAASFGLLVEEGSGQEAEDYIANLKSLVKEIDKITGIVDNIKEGKPVGFDDLIDFADAHPEIMAAINDTNALLGALNNLKEMDMAQAVQTLRDSLMNSVDFAAMQSIIGVGEGQTLNQFKLNQDDTVNAFVDSYVDRVIASFLASTDKLGSVGKDILGNWMNSIFSESNVDLLNREIVDMGDSFATLLTETFMASTDGSKGMKWNQNIVMNLTPITPDGQVLDQGTFNQYVEDLLAKSSNIEELFENDKAGKGLLISAEVVVDQESFDAAISNAESLAELLHMLQEAYYGAAEAEKSWLEIQIEQQELTAANEWAKSNNYVDQIESLKNALTDGGMEAAMDVWNSWGESNQKLQEALIETYPELGKAILEVQKALEDTSESEEDAAAATDKLSKSLSKAQRYATAKYFKDTYAAIQKLEKGTISAEDAYASFNKELDNYKKAGEEITDVNAKMAEGTAAEASDVKNLASVLGISAEKILADWPGAIDVFNEMRKAGQEAYDALNREAIMKITGVGDADFSALMSGMVAVQDTADSTVQMLLALGAFKLEEREVQEGIDFPIMNGNKGITMMHAETTGRYQFLVPTGNNPLGGSARTAGGSGGKKGGGGGGGGGKKDQKGPTEVAKALDVMSQVNDIQEYQQSFYQAHQNYYSGNGQIQGVIAFMEQELDLLNEQNTTLESNIKTIEEYMAAKREEIAGLDETDEKYAEVSDDLDKLQKAHQNYTKQLIENKTAVDDLNKSIKEQRDKIRDMEIELRNTIYKAIEDRENRLERMIDAEVDMENHILDIITRRYEKERDQIIETTELKIAALQEESNLLSEQLQLRKRQAEQEDKVKKLTELELQYQRIIADPTRAKEAKEIYKDIRDLREELAWDAAESEIEAQQDSIDQQVESLEDYIQNVTEYYEDLFEHPQQLIAEMEEIMAKTDEEIIEWLQSNDEEYAKSTQTRQQQMIREWQNTLDSIKGKIKAYWDEVESIISKGDDYIIQFLKDNSEDYARAGKLQAEKYVDEWKKQLEDLKKAYQDVAKVAADSYTVINKAGSSGESSGGGGGGGGGNQTKTPKYWTVTVNGVEKRFDSEKKAKDYKLSAEAGYGSQAGAGYSMLPEAERKKKIAAYVASMVGPVVPHYKSGGLADFTGLAWMDGTPQEPEIVLNSYQTKLFETMVQALERLGTVQIPTMPNLSDLDISGAGGFSVGDIIINVDNLDTDDDYETVADKVYQILMERIGKTAVVGGIRIN